MTENNFTTLPVLHRYKIVRTRRNMLEGSFLAKRRAKITDWWNRQKNSDKIIKIWGVPSRGDELIDIYIDEEDDRNNLNIIQLCLMENRLDVFQYLLEKKKMSCFIASFGNRSDSFNYLDILKKPKSISKILDANYLNSAFQNILLDDNYDAMIIALKYDKSNLFDPQEKFVQQWMFLCFAYGADRCLNYLTSLDKYKKYWMSENKNDVDADKHKLWPGEYFSSRNTDHHPLTLAILYGRNIDRSIAILEKNGMSYKLEMEADDFDLSKRTAYRCMSHNNDKGMRFMLDNNLNPNIKITSSHKINKKDIIPKTHPDCHVFYSNDNTKYKQFKANSDSMDFVEISILRGDSKMLDLFINANYQWRYEGEDNWLRIKSKYTEISSLGLLNYLNEELFEYAKQVQDALSSKQEIQASIQSHLDSKKSRGKSKI